MPRTFTDSSARLSWRGAVADGCVDVGGLGMLLLQDDGRIVLGASPETLPVQQMVKLDQRSLRHARGPELHAGAGHRIQDPRRGHDDDARRRLEVNNRARYTLLAALAPDTTPEERVPAIVDLDLLPDMGRMAGRLPSGASRGCSAAPTGAASAPP
jgi:hypothetical protein